MFTACFPQDRWVNSNPSPSRAWGLPCLHCPPVGDVEAPSLCVPLQSANTHTLMGKDPSMLLAHTYSGVVTCCPYPMGSNHSQGQDPHGIRQGGCSLWSEQGLWCHRATSGSAKPGLTPVLSTAKPLPLVMDFHAFFILHPVTPSLYQKTLYNFPVTI